MTTPLEMPFPLPVNASSFDLAYVQDVSPVGAGFIQTINRTTPPWVAKYTTPPLTDNLYQAFQSFLDSLQGSQYTFLGFDPRRMRPFAYKNYPMYVTPYLGVGGQLTVTSTNPATNAISLAGFAVGASLVSGDYVSFLSGGAWYLHRAASTGIANAFGQMSLQVYPTPMVTLTGTPTVVARIDRACAEMKIIGGISKNDQVSDKGPIYSFSAVQYINRVGS